jgi:hypothetical protein
MGEARAIHVGHVRSGSFAAAMAEKNVDQARLAKSRGRRLRTSLFDLLRNVIRGSPIALLICHS